MEYIATRRYRGKTMQGKEVNIPTMTKGIEEYNIIQVNGFPICYKTSLVAHKYFSRNDDGQGMRRGAITYAIAYDKRIRYNTSQTVQQRFTDEEIEIIENRWEKFLKENPDVILFNNDFFNAEIDELEEMAKSLNIKIKE